MSHDETADVLDLAAFLIETIGHAKHQETVLDSRGNIIGYCLAGALDKAQIDLEYQALPFAALRAVSAKVGRSAIQWNDEPDRTPEEVVDALRSTAKELRNAEQRNCG